MNIGVVAIGRNEGERLRACLQSARRDCAVVVYVDSGSSDGSVELARAIGASVVELDLNRPFTAARARNEGFDRLMAIDSTIEFVQFVDGDCEIVTGWIAVAATEMAGNVRAGVVCGRRRERFAEKSIYNRLCDLEWNTPVGEVMACGGDALIRAAAFSEVGGYDPSVIAGEEPEMCVRLRRKGWTIRRIDAEMTLHDAGMTRAWQWWKRTVRSGHAYAQGYAMHGRGPDYFRRREVRSIEFWAVWPIVGTAMFIVLMGILRPGWMLIAFTPLLVYPLLVMKIAWNRWKKDSAGHALLYSIAVVFGKFPQHLGLRTYRRGAAVGRVSAIIEYKGMGGGSKGLIVQGGHDVR